jgi:hypothetical protein
VLHNEAIDRRRAFAQRSASSLTKEVRTMAKKKAKKTAKKKPAKKAAKKKKK